MKLVDMDGNLASRKELAKDLNYTGDTSDKRKDECLASQEVIRKISENGGKVRKSSSLRSSCICIAATARVQCEPNGDALRSLRLESNGAVRAISGSIRGPVRQPPKRRSFSGERTRSLAAFLRKQRAFREPSALTKDLFGGTPKSHTRDGCAPQRLATRPRLRMFIH
jgi:hypothetical protein